MLTEGNIPDHLPLDGVEIIPPTWDRTIIANLYRRAHCFVLPSRLETWGDVFLEAMSYSLPCIGVDDEAMREVIDHQKTGLVVPPENTEALAQALVQPLYPTRSKAEMGSGRSKQS